jgi:hypothetical protein
MSIITRILEKLQKYPDIRYQYLDRSLTIYACNSTGFDISVIESEDQIIVSFAGWHEHFPITEGESALNCVAFGLSEDCRLEVRQRSNVSYKWLLQRREGDEWKTDSQTGKWFFPFWRKRKITYLQNRLARE